MLFSPYKNYLEKHCIFWGDVLPHKLRLFAGSSISVVCNSPVHAATMLVLLTVGSNSSQKVSQNPPDTFSPCFMPICSL